MCGIAGIVGQDAKAETLGRMLLAQKHRGPDYTGTEIYENQLALGHNRLSIIDLSSISNQPFESSCKRYVIVFNGEIYNYLELKDELKPKYSFRTSSDTEVLLNAFAEWGKEALHKLSGMFSFVVWDRQEQTLFAARDRFGVKPFYYFFDNKNFIFASEINAVFAAGVPKVTHDRVWLNFLSDGSYGQPGETFWKNIHQLEAGHFLVLKNKALLIQKWYYFEDRIAELQHKFEENEEEYITHLLLKAVNLRFRADVPVGFNLSGGLDSSTLLALIDQQDIDKSTVEAFTFVTHDDRYDEIKWVRAMLQSRSFHLNVCPLSACEVPELSLKIAKLQMEPFGGIPTLAYSRIFQAASRKGVKVLLDGQGSDEAWAGYDYYINGNQSTIQGVSKSPFRPNVLDHEFRKEYHRTTFPHPFREDLLNLQYRDLFYTKIPRTLRFNDRVSMMYGTELREPFLDYELVEYAFSRPQDFKIKKGIQKWMLRKISQQFLQKDLVLAPKRPLQTPQREWLSIDLKEWVISETDSLMNHSWFDKKQLQDELDLFYKGNNQSSFHIWQWVNIALILKLENEN